jgi:hypothetical protein
MAVIHSLPHGIEHDIHHKNTSLPSSNSESSDSPFRNCGKNGNTARLFHCRHLSPATIPAIKSAISHTCLCLTHCCATSIAAPSDQGCLQKRQTKSGNISSNIPFSGNASRLSSTPSVSHADRRRYPLARIPAISPPILSATKSAKTAMPDTLSPAPTRLSSSCASLKISTRANHPTIATAPATHPATNRQQNRQQRDRPPRRLSASPQSTKVDFVARSALRRGFNRPPCPSHISGHIPATYSPLKLPPASHESKKEKMRTVRHMPIVFDTLTSIRL